MIGVIVSALGGAAVTLLVSRLAWRQGPSEPPPDMEPAHPEPPRPLTPMAIPNPFPQRPEPTEESFELRDDPLWQPGLPIDPVSTDCYAVIDERIDNTITLAVSGWPKVDRGGRLRFGQSWSIGVDAEELRHAVIQSPTRPNQQTADRSLRIGDAFLVRGLIMRPLNEASPNTWGAIVDASAPARAATKAALAAATAPVLPEDFAIVENKDGDGHTQGRAANPKV